MNAWCFICSKSQPCVHSKLPPSKLPQHLQRIIRIQVIDLQHFAAQRDGPRAAAARNIINLMKGDQ